MFRADGQTDCIGLDALIQQFFRAQLAVGGGSRMDHQTLITGFPGETDEQFDRLAEFVQEMEFDRLGCFAYSQEDGTKAAEFPDQVD